MRLVEIDMVRLQSTERSLRRFLDIGGFEPLFPLHPFPCRPSSLKSPYRACHFEQTSGRGSFHFRHPGAPAPAGIDIRCIDEIESPVDERVQDLERGRFIGGPAEDISAEHDRSHFDLAVTESSFFHFCSSLMLFQPSVKTYRRDSLPQPQVHPKRCRGAARRFGSRILEEATWRDERKVNTWLGVCAMGHFTGCWRSFCI